MTTGQARPAFDLTLYLVVGAADVGGRELIDVVAAAVRGGVTLVQLREKDRPSGAVIAAAKALKALLAPLGVPLIINDDVKAVLAAGADGVHLGQDDAEPRAARSALGPDRIIGLSAGDAAEARNVDPAIVDYAGVGPAYVTGSKADAGAAIGPAGLRAVRQRLSLPIVAIGGISADNAAEVMRCGVEGVAVVSAICAAPDPETAARRLRQVIDAARVGP